MKKAFLFLVEYAKQNNISFEDAARRYLQSNGVFQSAVKDYILRAGRIPNVGILEQAKQAGFLILEAGGEYMGNFLELEPGEIPTLYRKFNFYGFANEFPVAFVACVALATDEYLSGNTNSNFDIAKGYDKVVKATKEAQKIFTDAVKGKGKGGEAQEIFLDESRKIALAPARGPFLLLVRLNVFNLARRLNRAIGFEREKMKNFWEDLGGDFVQLLNMVEKGKKEMPILPGKSQTFSGKYSSAEPVSTAATVTAATPITTKVAIALQAIDKIYGIYKETKEDAQKLKDDAQKVKDDAQKVKDDIQKGIDDAKKLLNLGNEPQTNTPGATPGINPGQRRETPATPAAKNNNTILLLVGAGLIGAYLIFKKKI